jgi:hypothetical protein
MPVMTGTVTSYDVPTNARDVSDIFIEIKYGNTPLMNEIEVREAVKDKTFAWWEDRLLPTSSTIKTGSPFTAGEGQITLESAHGVRIGTIIRCESSLYRVTSVNVTTGVCEIVVIKDDANHAEAVPVYFQNTANVENSSRKPSDYTPEIQIENVCQIIRDDLEISETELAIEQEVGPSDLLSKEAVKKMKRIYRQLAWDIWWGYKVKPAGKNEPRIMGGVDYFISNYGFAPAPAAFSPANLDAFIYEMDQTYRAEVVELWMNPHVRVMFADLNDSLVRVSREDKTVGRIVDRYISKHGYELRLRADANAPNNKIFLMTPNQIGLRPLRRRQFQVKQIAEDGDDGVKTKLIGEYTMEINPCTTMGVFTIG